MILKINIVSINQSKSTYSVIFEAKLLAITVSYHDMSCLKSACKNRTLILLIWANDCLFIRSIPICTSINWITNKTALAITKASESLINASRFSSFVAFVLYIRKKYVHKYTIYVCKEVIKMNNKTFKF